MKTKIFACFIIAALAGLVAGCVETVDGRTQMGVPFVKDSVEGRYEVPVARVVDASEAVLRFNGVLLSKNTVNNSLSGRVNEETVWVKVDQIDPARPVSRVVVQARGKAGGSDVDLAHDIEKQIALQLQAH